MAGSTKLLEALGIDVPIVQAPMAGVSTPAMAAAVSNAGALGSIGVGATGAAGGGAGGAGGGGGSGRAPDDRRRAREIAAPLERQRLLSPARQGGRGNRGGLAGTPAPAVRTLR